MQHVSIEHNALMRATLKNIDDGEDEEVDHKKDDEAKDEDEDDDMEDHDDDGEMRMKMRKMMNVTRIMKVSMRMMIRVMKMMIRVMKMRRIMKVG